jgi:hypothetical protein
MPYLALQLVESLGLPYEVVGSSASLRLRILPPVWAGEGSTAGGSGPPKGGEAAAVAAAVEGARQKDYW